MRTTWTSKRMKWTKMKRESIERMPDVANDFVKTYRRRSTRTGIPRKKRESLIGKNAKAKSLYRYRARAKMISGAVDLAANEAEVFAMVRVRSGGTWIIATQDLWNAFKEGNLKADINDDGKVRCLAMDASISHPVIERNDLEKLAKKWVKKRLVPYHHPNAQENRADADTEEAAQSEDENGNNSTEDELPQVPEAANGGRAVNGDEGEVRNEEGVAIDDERENAEDGSGNMNEGAAIAGNNNAGAANDEGEVASNEGGAGSNEGGAAINDAVLENSQPDLFVQSTSATTGAAEAPSETTDAATTSTGAHPASTQLPSASSQPSAAGREPGQSNRNMDPGSYNAFANRKKPRLRNPLRLGWGPVGSWKCGASSSDEDKMGSSGKLGKSSRAKSQVHYAEGEDETNLETRKKKKPHQKTLPGPRGAPPVLSRDTVRSVRKRGKNGAPKQKQARHDTSSSESDFYEDSESEESQESGEFF